MSGDDEVDVVRLGDRIRFSVELIRDLAVEAAQRSLVAEVSEIRREGDGTKTLILYRVYEPPFQ
jgi:translation elongation factor EF-Tu-like GTPase